MAKEGGPKSLGEALSELIALRGLARARGDADLLKAWIDVAGREVAKQSRPLSLQRGTLVVAVSQAGLLAELAGFHKQKLLQEFKLKYAKMNVKNLKFRLDGEVKSAL